MTTTPAETLARRAPGRARPDLRGLFALLVALAAAVVAITVVLTGIAAVLLLGTWLAGIALTCAAGTRLRLEERLCWGAPVGAIAVGSVLLALGLAAGRLTIPLVLAAIAVPLTAGLIFAWARRRRFRREL
ncbi:MAG: hypothetical protein ACREQM_07325, partial [Candidatus Dormibacteraceae bacterium]